jgi:hypothetical protein
MKTPAYYSAIYEKIMYRAKNRESITGYIENHHIIPRCMGGTDEKENIVPLTPEEHYVCHQLLVKIYPDHVGLWRAVYMMTYATNSTKGRKGNKLYGWLKRKNKWKERVLNKCQYCGKENFILKCFKRKFCSKSCKNSSQQIKINKKCKHCENDFFVTSYESKKRKFCSPECSSLSQKRIAKKNCKKCKKEFSGEPNLISKRTFCSLKCVSESLKGIKRMVPERVKITSKPCKYCGKPIYGKPGKLKQKKHCSTSCGAKSRWKA